VSSADPDVIVIGSGPNGLTAACTLAMAGLRILVLEAHPTRPGGALASEQATLPGFVHDVGAGFFPFHRASRAFQHLDLTAHGLVWAYADIESCHPAPDGSVACITRDSDVSAARFGTREDGERWRTLVRWHAGIERALLDALLEPVPAIRPLLRLLPFDVLRVASVLLSSGRGFSTRWFRSAAARRVLPSLALHVDVGPDDRFGAGLGYMLGLTASTGGNAVPRGGAGAITDTLVAVLKRHGGQLLLGHHVDRILVSNGRASGVRVSHGTDVVDISANRAIFADTSAPSLLLELVERKLVPGRIVRKMERFPFGWGTFKLDWALSGPVPWMCEPARHSAVVHAGDDLDDLARFTHEVRAGNIPEHPYLVMGQQSLIDPSRAPPGKHTLWAYSRVPSHVSGGWDAHKEVFADRVEDRIEGLAPGFKALVLARRCVSPHDLEQMDANLVGGDLGGGSNAWYRQLVFRPSFPYFRYRMPVRGLYLCSSYAHPGAGVHGMCGYNAARVALRD